MGNRHPASTGVVFGLGAAMAFALGFGGGRDRRGRGGRRADLSGLLGFGAEEQMAQLAQGQGGILRDEVQQFGQRVAHPFDEPVILRADPRAHPFQERRPLGFRQGQLREMRGDAHGPTPRRRGFGPAGGD